MSIDRKDFFVPVELARHPMEERIGVEHGRWLTRIGLLPQARATDFVESLRMAEWGSLLWPFACYSEVVWGVNSTGYAFLLEEAFEGPHQLESAASQTFVKGVVDAARGCLDARASASAAQRTGGVDVAHVTEGPCRLEDWAQQIFTETDSIGRRDSSQGACSIWQRGIQECVVVFTSGTSQRWADRHREFWCQVLHGYLAEQRHRQRGGDLDFEQMLAFRCRLVGGAPVLDLVESLARKEIPWHIREQPDMLACFRLCIELLMLANDVMSLGRERDMGDFNNTVMAYRREHDCTWDIATDYVLGQFNSRGHHVVDRVKGIRRHPQVRRLSASEGAT